jgi:hypothetical protein
MREDPIISRAWIRAGPGAAGGDIDRVTACFDRFSR